MFKKTIIFVFFILIMGAILFSFSFEKKSTSDDNILENITSDELLTWLDQKQSGIIYVGRPTCDYCNAFLPTLTEGLRSTGKQALYFNTDDATNEAQFDRILSLLNVDIVPSVIAIKEGAVSNKIEGNVSLKTTLSWLENI